jgi:Superinfection immunity protein
MTAAAVLPATTGARMSLYLGAGAVIAAWMVPLIIAWLYGLPRKGAIAVLSLALGWTGVAWLAALLIAVAGAIRAPAPRKAGADPFPATASPRERPETARHRGERPPSPAARQPEQVPDRPAQRAYERPPQQAHERPPERAYERPPQQAHERPPERAYERPPQGAHGKSPRPAAGTPERAYERPPQRASGGRYGQ